MLLFGAGLVVGIIIGIPLTGLALLVLVNILEGKK